MTPFAVLGVGVLGVVLTFALTPMRALPPPPRHYPEPRDPESPPPGPCEPETRTDAELILAAARLGEGGRAKSRAQAREAFRDVEAAGARGETSICVYPAPGTRLLDLLDAFRDLGLRCDVDRASGVVVVYP